jgi:hypothetical protein
MRALLLGLGSAVFSLGACATEEIVAARDGVPGAGSSGKPGGGGAPPAPSCRSQTDCRPEELCERANCDAPEGVCRARPTICDAAALPVCGCDGINYLNDCLRRGAGVSLAVNAECGREGLECTVPGSCPGEAYCAHLGPPTLACGTAPGRCWVIPPTCAVDDPNRFTPCGPRPGGCVDTCTAIRAETPFARAGRCP